MTVRVYGVPCNCFYVLLLEMLMITINHQIINPIIQILKSKLPKKALTFII